MSERLTLIGDMKQKVLQALIYAGWYSGRKVDITKVEDYYSKFGIVLSTKAKDFFSEYYGIMSQWYIEINNLEWGADFEFRLFPYPKPYKIDVVDFMYDDAEYIIKSEEYENVLKLVPEQNNMVMVGEIGRYYPARVWMDECGKLYATHDYEDDVLFFDSLIDLIEYEVKGCTFSSIAFKN